MKEDSIYPRVIYSFEIVPFFSGDHKGSQRGSVNSQKDNGKQGPNGSHESCCKSTGTIHVNGRLEQ